MRAVARLEIGEPPEAAPVAEPAEAPVAEVPVVGLREADPQPERRLPSDVAMLMVMRTGRITSPCAARARWGIWIPTASWASGRSRI